MNRSNATLWYVVFLLTIASTLSFIDRQILNVMIGPIKRDLGGLSDTEISLIIGLAFSAVYSLTTLPLARIADRYSRRNVIAAGIFSWSAMTALAGMANSFWTLFVARMGVGVGEASLGPATQSILADYFEQHRLPLAYGIVAAAPFIGTGLANIVGGPLIDYLEARPLIVMPVFGEMYSWQTVLVVVGLPGILLALLMFTIKEPESIEIEVEVDDSGQISLAEDDVSEELSEEPIQEEVVNEEILLTEGIDTELESMILQLEETRLTSERNAIIGEGSKTFSLHLRIEKIERTLLGQAGYRGGQSMHGMIDGGPYHGVIQIHTDLNERALDYNVGDEIQLLARIVDYKPSIKRTVMRCNSIHG